MTLNRGRIRKQATLEGVEPSPGLFHSAPKTGRVLKSQVLEAETRAREIVGEAVAEAAALLAAARRETAEVRLRAEAEGRADGVASLAARALALAKRESESAERQLDTVVELARMLAERLLGEALALAPEHVVALARSALSEARGVRAVKIVAHPGDAVILEQDLNKLGSFSGVVSIESDASRTRGNLRMITDVGILDAELSPALDRLAMKLRESLRHER
jgi:flagellar biosynthesis/type III secretory pathway protein FliH